MIRTSPLRTGVIGALIVLGGLCAHGYAGTNSIQEEEAQSTVGLGSAVVQKLVINDVDVDYDANNKNLATGLTFTIPPLTLSATSDTHAWLQPDGGTVWIACGTVTNHATTISCPYNGPVDRLGRTSGGSPAPLRLVTAD